MHKYLHDHKSELLATYNTPPALKKYIGSFVEEMLTLWGEGCLRRIKKRIKTCNRLADEIERVSFNKPQPIVTNFKDQGEYEKAKKEYKRQRRAHKRAYIKTQRIKIKNYIEDLYRWDIKKQQWVDYLQKNKFKPGWIYVFSNKCMPGLVKIGSTSGSVNKRAEKLLRETAGVPGPFTVEYKIWSPRARWVEENQIHKVLEYKDLDCSDFVFHDRDFEDDYDPKNPKESYSGFYETEFFKITPEEAIKVVKENVTKHSEIIYRNVYLS